MSPKWLKNRSRKVGLAPGELVSLSDETQASDQIAWIAYDSKKYEEQMVTPDKLVEIHSSTGVNWLKFSGLPPVKDIRQVGEVFQLHNLILEDIISTDQRPKVDFQEDSLFVVVRLPSYHSAKNELALNQISIVLKKNWVISFQENTHPIFDTILDRLRHHKGKIRDKGADYLLYTLLDAVVDHYYPLLEKIGDKIEDVELRVEVDDSRRVLHVINKLKRDMIFLRKSILPLQELITNLIQEESDLVDHATEKYLRDLYDHMRHIGDTINIYREITAHMLEVHMTVVNNHLNEIMKMLAVISTIFMPLTFLVGVYGMNFHHMPELSWRWGYQAVWGVMLLLSGLSIAYFKKKRWF